MPHGSTVGERPGAARVGGIAVSLVGVGLVSFDGSSGGAGGRRLLGDMLVVGGAAAYAAYEVLYRWLLVGDLASGAEVNAATALVGVTSLLTTWPLFPALDLAGVETFAEPVPADLWPWIALNAALALVFNVAIMVSVAYLSPVTAACATMLTIPLSAVVDYFFRLRWCGETVDLKRPAASTFQGWDCYGRGKPHSNAKKR